MRKGQKHTEEAKKKIREKRKLQIIKHSEETKQKISDSHKEGYISGKIKLSSNCFKKGHKMNLGRKHSEETIQKMKQTTSKQIEEGTFKPFFQKGHKINIGGNKGSFKKGHPYFGNGKTLFKKRHIPWSKGLTKETDERLKRLGENTSKTLKRLHKENKIKPWNYIDGRSKLLPPARYGDDWEAIRYLVYLRDKFTCQKCGITGKSLDIHHKIPFLISRDNSLNNLITLCRKCHMEEERRIRKELKKKGEVIIL